MVGYLPKANIPVGVAEILRAEGRGKTAPRCVSFSHNQRTPHDLYHTQQMKTYDTIGVQDKVEGRFVD